MTGKKHILILPRWYPNKTDVQLGSFIQQQALLLKDEFHVHVIYVQAIENQNQPFDIDSRADQGIDEQIVYFKSAKGPLKKIFNAKRYKKAQRLAYLLDPYTPALCHIHVPYRSAFLALALKKNGIPFVITEHWSGHLTGAFDQKNSADKRLYKAVLGKASAIATVSELPRKKFLKNTGFDSVVIPNLINTPHKSSVHRSDKIELLTVADLNDQIKNISGLLNALKLAVVDNNNLRLTIIGGGPDEAILHKLTSDLNLSEHVIFKGRLPYEAVLSAYQNCDFYVCNSNFETFGMAAAEALIAGKPVVSTRCGGPEEFLNNDNSILIETANTEELAQAILRMADLYTNYGAELISQEVQERFGKDRVKEKLQDFYSNVIQ